MSFHFKQFSIKQDRCSMKVGTDGVLLGAWSKAFPNEKVLDIGTGTGLVTLMLAQKEPTATFVGVEINKSAASQASENAASSPFCDRIQIEAVDIQTYSALNQSSFDLIVSNPPFFAGDVLSDNMERMHVRHTIKLSHEDLLKSVQKLLKKDGRFCLILPTLESRQFQELAKKYRLFTSKKCVVRPRSHKPPNRLLIEMRFDFSRPENEIISEEMSIYANEKGDMRSNAFQVLTKNYYLRE